MTAQAVSVVQPGHLVALIEDAVSTLTNARSAGEILDARDKAALVYDVAKRAARLAKAKDAHNTVVAAAHRAQAQALEIEAGAKRRLADEYDAAQERGEINRHGGDRKTIKFESSKLEDVTPSDLHEARQIRDAEEADPGIVKRTLDDAIESGEEPTRAKLKRAVKGKIKRHARPQFDNPVESQHDRDLRMLLGVWEAACETARTEFLTIIKN